jgi:hypothetical protein
MQFLRKMLRKTFSRFLRSGYRKPKGQSRMDNPEKLAILDILDTRRRQVKQRNKTQYGLDTTMCKL